MEIIVPLSRDLLSIYLWVVLYVVLCSGPEHIMNIKQKTTEIWETRRPARTTNEQKDEPFTFLMFSSCH